jgi:Tfp pilus assembly protein PilF
MRRLFAAVLTLAVAFAVAQPAVSDDAATHLNRAKVLINGGDYDAAMRDLSQAIQIDPKLAEAYNVRGFIYHRKKDYDLAIADFDQAIRLNPKSAATFNNRGNSWLEKGDFARALTDLNQAVQLGPTQAAFYNNRGSAKREQGDLDGALTDYEQALRLDPRLPSPFVGRGVVWRAKGNFDRAIGDYNQAIALNPNLASAWGGRGLAYESKGDIEKAKRDYNTAISLASGAVIRGGKSESFLDIAADRFKDIARARLAVLTSPGGTAPTAPAPAVRDAAAPDDAGRRIALVIGNGAYPQGSTLANPPNDARAVARTLRDIGFDVAEGIDLDRAGFERTVRDFLAKAAQARTALVFYAGHGVQIDGRNYLVPVDAQIASGEKFTADMTALDTILAGLDDQIRTNIVILDACRDNPLAAKAVADAGASRSLAVRSGLAAPSDLGKGGTLGAGTLLAFATAPGEVALDGAGANSPFSTALLRHLATPGLEVQAMLTRVRADVVAVTHNRQVPWSNSSLLGEVFLAGKP